jgi:hypothetical protein
MAQLITPAPPFTGGVNPCALNGIHCHQTSHLDRLRLTMVAKGTWGKHTTNNISLASGEFRVRPKKTRDADQMMPVQSLSNCQHDSCPTATATATHPMKEALRKMKIMRVGIIKSIQFKFLSRKRL